MKFKEFISFINNLYNKTELLIDLDSKEDKTIYEKYIYDSLKTSVKNYNNILCNITGDENVENFFKVKLSILEKHLIPILKNLGLSYEIKYLNESENYISYKPCVDIRIKEPANSSFGDLYYHIEYLNNVTEPLDKENTYIILRPLLDPYMWNEICMKVSYEQIIKCLWSTLKEQLTLNGKINNLLKYKSPVINNCQTQVKKVRTNS